MEFKLTSPLDPINELFSTVPNTNLSELFNEGIHIAKRNPQLLELIESDLDKMALEKKLERIEDDIWHKNKNLTLPEIDDIRDENWKDNVVLLQGRPRMPALLVLIFLLLRGYLGGIKKAKVQTFLKESRTLQIFLINQGYKMPGASTVIDNINGITPETHDAILDAQIDLIIDEGLDDFKEITADSTSVKSNSAWPVDSVIIMNLVLRMLQLIESFEKDNVSVKTKDVMNEFIKEIKQLNKQIQFSVGKKGSVKKRKKLYNKLYKIAKKARKYLIDAQTQAKSKISQLDVPPSKLKIVERKLERIEIDIHNLAVAIDHSSKRINQEIQTPSTDKVLSLADEDAALISKGQREPKLGYKPQICRSKNGFVPAIIVPEGNANDSGQLIPLIDQTIERTGVTPDILSFDDGYSSTKARDKYLGAGVKIVSFSGSKGKKIIPESEYESDEYQQVRNDRSAVESLMYTIKHNEDFGQVMRRGIEQVRAESIEKILVYNFFRIIEQRAKQSEHQKIAA